MNKRWTVGSVMTLFVVVITYFTSVTSAVSSDESIVLEGFLKKLFTETAPYVLYGDKPMCLDGYFHLELLAGWHLKPLHEIGNSLADTYHPSNQMMVKGVRLWNQRFAHRPSNFLIKTCSNPFYRQVTEVLLINKANFLKTVEQNEEVFRARLSSFSSPEDFCQQCFASREMWIDVLEKDQVLMGILLGYGKRNAELFGRRDELVKKIKAMTVEDSYYEEAKEELSEVVHLLQGFPPDCEEPPVDSEAFLVEPTEREFLDQYVEFCPLPYFVADLSSEETKGLQRSYEKTRKEVRELYRGKPFLEQTLSHMFPDE